MTSRRRTTPLVVAVLAIVTLSACGAVDTESAPGPAVPDPVGPSSTPPTTDAVDPRAEMVDEFRRLVLGQELDAAQDRLSAPARVATDFGDAWGTSLDRLTERASEDGVIRIVDPDGTRHAVAVLESGVAIPLRFHAGSWTLEPTSPLASRSETWDEARRVTLPGEGLSLLVHPVYGMVVVGGAGSDAGPTPTTEPPLVRGDRGADVAELQELLGRWRRSVGEQPILVDGVFGPGTEAAVRDAEAALGLEVDGVADHELRLALEG